MAGRSPQHSRDEFAMEAMRLIDEQGFAALTARSLGLRMGVHATAIYRYFPALDDLLAAVLDRLLGEIVRETPDTQASPREQLHALMRRARKVLLQHPNVAGLLISSSGQSPNGGVLTLRVIAALELLGLEGAALVEAYQSLESVVLGATAFDLAAAPENVSIRRERYRLLGHPAFKAQASSLRKIAALNEAAFERSCVALLDSVEALAADS